MHTYLKSYSDLIFSDPVYLERNGSEAGSPPLDHPCSLAYACIYIFTRFFENLGTVTYISYVTYVLPI